jgi:hypothetical protein
MHYVYYPETLLHSVIPKTKQTMRERYGENKIPSGKFLKN